MDKILYKLLLPLVNDKSCYTILKEYAEARIALLQNNLSFEQDIDLSLIHISEPTRPY